MSLKILLLQARNSDDLVRDEERQSFAQKVGLDLDQVVPYDLILGPPSLQELLSYDYSHQRRYVTMQCDGSWIMGSPLVGVALGVGILAQEGPQRRFGIPWWGWILLLGLVIVLGVIWVLRGEGRAAGQQEAQPEAVTEPEAAPAGTRADPVSLAVEEAPAPPVVPDDLKRIEGIGPKISGILQAAGIATFAQLAQTGVGRLQEILTEAGITRISDPSTWPEQARLAAASDWAGLEALQDKLKGGRRLE